ncbi:MAG: hypothetical protein P4L46_06130 [Fimbriimonas sp.]|nr:hypothetical protein [Fimbriimonas sp.]
MSHPRLHVTLVLLTIGALVACGPAVSVTSKGSSATAQRVYRLPADRATLWDPGITVDVATGRPLGSDRLPVRTQVWATIDAATYGNGARDATAGINSALAACPAGNVVKLSAGTFLVNSDIVSINRTGIVLRGAGAGVTRLVRTNGAKMGSYLPGVAMPVVIVGASRWPHPASSTSKPLAADGVKGTYSVTIANASSFTTGQKVLLDEETKGAWSALPTRSGSATATRIWKGDRVVWQFHNPSEGEDDPVGPVVGGVLTGGGASWFCRQDRPVCEVKEIASISGNVLTFSTPLHIGYRVSHAAQVTGYDTPFIEYSGVEALSVQGGSDGEVRFEAASRCWAKELEVTDWLGEGVAMDSSFRVVLRDSYVHDGAWPEPGGGGYAMSLADGSSEALIENNISIDVNKVIVSRCSGAGSAVGYNYMDNGWIYDSPSWVEAGVNGSHMVGCHHMLFEGNEAFNGDSDCTHGSSIYHTYYRNHLSGKRLGGRLLPEGPDGAKTLSDGGNLRCAGLGYGSRWMSFVGNVLGLRAQMVGWAYEDNGTIGGAQPYSGGKAVWRLGYDSVHWEQSGDPDVASTIIRDGNYDYVTNTVQWPTPDGGARILPDSLYLKAKPAFFGSKRWPWVDPMGQTKLYVLPAKARFDAGTPNRAQ